MKIYTFYMKPGETPLEAVIAVPERFSIGALLFGFIWALYRRLWLIAIVIFGVQLGLPFAAELLGLPPALGSVALLAFGIYVVVARMIGGARIGTKRLRDGRACRRPRFGRSGASFF